MCRRVRSTVLDAALMQDGGCVIAVLTEVKVAIDHFIPHHIGIALAHGIALLLWNVHGLDGKKRRNAIGIQMSQTSSTVSCYPVRVCMHVCGDGEGCV